MGNLPLMQFQKVSPLVSALAQQKNRAGRLICRSIVYRMLSRQIISHPIAADSVGLRLYCLQILGDFVVVLLLFLLEEKKKKVVR